MCDATVNGVAGVMGMLRLDGVVGESGHRSRGPTLKVESAVEVVEEEDMDETLKAGDTMPFRWRSSEVGMWRSWAGLAAPCESGDALDRTKFLMLERLKPARAGVLAAETGTEETADEEESGADPGEESADVGIW